MSLAVSFYCHHHKQQKPKAELGKLTWKFPTKRQNFTSAAVAFTVVVEEIVLVISVTMLGTQFSCFLVLSLKLFLFPPVLICSLLPNFLWNALLICTSPSVFRLYQLLSRLSLPSLFSPAVLVHNKAHAAAATAAG